MRGKRKCFIVDFEKKSLNFSKPIETVTSTCDFCYQLQANSRGNWLTLNFRLGFSNKERLSLSVHEHYSNRYFKKPRPFQRINNRTTLMIAASACSSRYKVTSNLILVVWSSDSRVRGYKGRSFDFILEVHDEKRYFCFLFFWLVLL